MVQYSYELSEQLSDASDLASASSAVAVIYEVASQAGATQVAFYPYRDDVPMLRAWKGSGGDLFWVTPQPYDDLQRGDVQASCLRLDEETQQLVFERLGEYTLQQAQRVWTHLRGSESGTDPVVLDLESVRQLCRALAQDASETLALVI